MNILEKLSKKINSTEDYHKEKYISRKFKKLKYFSIQRNANRSITKTSFSCIKLGIGYS